MNPVHTILITVTSLCYFPHPSRADYLHALELDPAHLPAHVNLALVLQAEGKFQEAWNALTAALERNRYYVPALEARAIVCLQMGNLFESFMDLSTAIDVREIRQRADTCL